MFNKILFGMNMFRWVHVAILQCGSPIPHKRDRDLVPIIKSGRT
jgi:hypothetical protein